MKEFVFTTTTNCFVCFLGKFEDTKKSFRNYLTFSTFQYFLEVLVVFGFMLFVVGAVCVWSFLKGLFLIQGDFCEGRRHCKWEPQGALVSITFTSTMNYPPRCYCVQSQSVPHSDQNVRKLSGYQKLSHDEAKII